MSKTKMSLIAGAIIVLAVVSMLAWVGIAQAVVIERVGVSSANVSPNPAISADGRYVAFEYGAVFVHDRLTGLTERVSVSGDGTEADLPSGSPCISADGRYVAFSTKSSNLVPGDTNGRYDVFVHDRTTGATIRANVDSSGAETDGDVYSPRFTLSADGRYVAFESLATNVVPGDTNDVADAFVHDLLTGATERVSVKSDGSQGDFPSYYPSISADGRYVAFGSFCPDLAPSPGGNRPIYVRDRLTGTTEMVSIASDGTPADNTCEYPVISADGRFVAFSSFSSNLTPDTKPALQWPDIFVYDRQAGTTELVSVAADGSWSNRGSSLSAISADGRYVAFASSAWNLVPGGTIGYPGIFVRDRAGGTTSRVDMALGGVQANGVAGSPSISADGRLIAFGSNATNLVPGDSAPFIDVFVAVNPATLTATSLRGSDRYDTALKISRAMFPGPLPAGSGLVLAPGATFPEALCGGPLAAAYGGPVLLTPSTGLNNAVRAEILRLAPQKVFCIGLPNAVVTAVQNALGTAGTAVVIRGSSVYDMSYQVAKALRDELGDMSGATAIITRGDKFPDAIGVSPLACAQKWPILLTSGSNVLSSSSTLAMSDLGITRALKVGTYVTLPAWVTGVGNLSGGDRYQTNRNVAEWGKANAGLAFTHLAIATGDKFPDALAAGPYLAQAGGILLLSPLRGPLPACIGDEIHAHAADVYKVSFLACIEPVVGQVRALLP